MFGLSVFLYDTFSRAFNVQVIRENGRTRFYRTIQFGIRGGGEFMVACLRVRWVYVGAGFATSVIRRIGASAFINILLNDFAIFLLNYVYCICFVSYLDCLSNWYAY